MPNDYILIKVGYEGIDELVWLSPDSNIIKGIRERAIKVDIAEANLRSKRFKFDRIFSDKEITDRYCVMQWDGKHFKCVCHELGIELQEMVLF